MLSTNMFSGIRYKKSLKIPKG